MKGVDTGSGVDVQRLPDGTLEVTDGMGGEIRLTPAEAPDLASMLMDYAADTDDWPDAQRGGAT